MATEPQNLVELQLENTVQEHKREDGDNNVGFMFWPSPSGQILPPWWSKARDARLRSFWQDVDHFMGAQFMMSTKLTSVPFVVEPRDTSIKRHIAQADYYNLLFDEGIQFGEGWQTFWSLFFQDLWTQDNGAFGEVIGGGDPLGPIDGPVYGLGHLDSYRCTRTGNPEFPVNYQGTDSKYYKFHHTRVIYTSQYPSAAAEMNQVGYCWLTRCINVAQNLKDILIYKQEKLGSRPARQMMIGKGIKTGDLMELLMMADDAMDNAGLTRFAKMVVAASTNPDFDIVMRDLASFPDGFTEEESVRLNMFVIALAGGFPPRWLWPAQTAGATKADAFFSHIAGTGGGASWHINKMQTLLGGNERGKIHMRGKVLPPYLRLRLDYRDDEMDRMQADVSKVRSETRDKDLSSGVITIRVAREQALTDGDITGEQFVQLELTDGRLQNNDDVLTLFSSVEPFFIETLDLGVNDPLLINVHDPADMLVEIEAAALNVQDILANSAHSEPRLKANQALSALGKLKELYSGILTQQLQEEVNAEIAAGGPMPGESGQPGADQPKQPKAPEAGKPGEDQPPEKPEGEAPESEQETKEVARGVQITFKENAENSVIERVCKELETVEKSRSMITGDEYNEILDNVLKTFNYGARLGEVIAGNLARGEGGRFVNVNALRGEMIQRLLERLRGKRAGGSGGGAAESKREANREGVAEKLGIAPGKLGGLADIRSGDSPDAATQAALISGGLATMNEDGSMSMTAGGRSLLNAANSGDADKARKALEDAKKGKGGKKRGGGGKAPKDPEAEKRKAGAKAATDRLKQYEDIAGQTPGLETADLTALTRFTGGSGLYDQEGNEIPGAVPLDPDVAQRLAKAGMVRYDSEGNPVATSEGRALITAANKGDDGGVSSVLSKAKDRVNKVRDRANAKRDSAADKRGSAQDLRAQADEIAIEAAIAGDELLSEAQTDAALLTGQVDSVQDEALAAFNESQEALQPAHDAAVADANKKRGAAQVKIDRKREDAQEVLSDAETRANDKRAQAAASDDPDKAARLTAQADEILSDAETKAARLNEDADIAEAAADEKLTASVEKADAKLDEANEKSEAAFAKAQESIAKLQDDAAAILSKATEASEKLTGGAGAKAEKLLAKAQVVDESAAELERDAMEIGAEVGDNEPPDPLPEDEPFDPAAEEDQAAQQQGGGGRKVEEEDDTRRETFGGGN